VLTWTGL